MDWLSLEEEAGEEGWAETQETQWTLCWTRPAGMGEIYSEINLRGNYPLPNHYNFQRPGITTSVGVWARLSSMPLNSRSNPTGTDDVAGSRTWSDVWRGSGSGAIVGSVLLSGSGSYIMAGLVSLFTVGSSIISMQLMRVGWLGSRCGVWLVMSTGLMVNGDPLPPSNHSANAVKFSSGLSTGRRALDHSLRLV